MAEVEKTRYNDEELAEFKAIILEMLEKAKKEYFELKRMLGINPKLETLIGLKEN